MNFADTYHAEVLQSRRDRSRRAFFWARIISLMLMITVAATLRAEPDLRRLLLTAGMDAVAQVADLRSPAFTAASTVTKDTQPTALPTSQIKVNRPATSPLVTLQP